MHLYHPHWILFPLSAHTGGSPTFMEYLLHSNVFNFLIAALVLFWAFRKFDIPGKLDAHHKAVVRDLEAAEAQKRKAQEQLEEIRRKTAGLEAEVAAILAGARESAETISDQIIRSAEEEAVKIIEASKKRMEQEQRAAARDLEARLLNDVIQEVREELAQRLTPDDRRRSVEAFLDELPYIKTGAQAR